MRSSSKLLSLLAVLVLAAAGCDWPMFGFSASGGRYNPSETAIGVGNVADLEIAWSADERVGSSSPVVAKGLVYTGADGSVVAYDATGSRGCSGKPKRCIPRWRGIVGGIASTPAVVNGVVYVGSSDGKVYAFAASGKSGCSRTRKTQTCTPLWTADTGGSATPVVANGVAYVASPDGNLYAFDASGTTNCSGSPKTCAPLWTADTGGAMNFSKSDPAVANGIVYVGSYYFGGTLFAFDASGTTNCSGSPKTCAPLWTGFPGDSSPAVVNGVVYIASDGDGGLSAFDAAGITNCSGTPKTCEPLLHFTFGGEVPSSLAVANGTVYRTVSGGNLTWNVVATAVSTGGHSWRSDDQFQVPVNSTPAVANGVVYNDSGGTLYAYDAATGMQLWSLPGAGSPIVANGYLYVHTSSGLTAFKP
jgi:outer membrane protein assembly factor BamB